MHVFSQRLSSLLLCLVVLGWFCVALVVSLKPDTKGLVSGRRTPRNDGISNIRREFSYDTTATTMRARAGFSSNDLKQRRALGFDVHVRIRTRKFRIDNEFYIQFQWNSHVLMHLMAQVDPRGLRFFARFFNREEDNNAMYNIKIRVRDIIEYVPSAPGAAYQIGVDTVVRRMDANWVWSPLEYSPVSISSDSRSVTAKSADGVFQGIFKLNQPASAPLVVTVNDMKVDFIVNNSALIEKGWLQTAGNRIALKGVIQTVSNMNHRVRIGDKNTTEVEVSDGDASSTFASFVWTDYIMCGNRTVTVATSNLTDDSSNPDNEESGEEFTRRGLSRANFVYWSFLDNDLGNTTETARTCIWDPVLAVQSAAAPTIVTVSCTICIARCSSAS